MTLTTSTCAFAVSSADLFFEGAGWAFHLQFTPRDHGEAFAWASRSGCARLLRFGGLFITVERLAK